MADPLSLLREFTINRKAITGSEDEFIFGEFSWPKSVKTNYIIWGTGKEDSQRDYYSLDCLLYLLKHVDIPHAQYIRQAAAAGVQGVRLPDRKDLLAYLNGDITAPGSIDRAAPVDISLRRPVSKRPSADMDKQSGDLDRGRGSGGLKLLNSGSMEPQSDAKRARQELEKQRLQAKLDAPSSAAPRLLQPEQIKGSSLLEAMPLEQIQAIQAKVRAIKQQTIKTDDAELVVGGAAVGGVTVQREIMARERVWKNRVTVLQSGGKKFFDSIQSILRNVKVKEEGGVPQGPGLVRGGVRGPTTPAALPGNRPVASSYAPPVHYSRYDQERFTGGQEDTLGFKIDTMGTYHGMTLTSMMRGQKEGTKPADPRNRDPRSAPPMNTGGNPSATPTATPDTRGYRSVSDARMVRQQKSRLSRTPIIIIPAALSSLITMFNAKDILQDLRYVTTEEKKSSGYQRDNEVLIHRMKAGGTTVPYRVVDQPMKLNSEEWDRVVAVFAQGQAWQFKGWPIERDPVDILTMIRGFHLKWRRMPLDTNVKKWNVHVVELDDRRHLDKASFQEVWEVLDRHMARAKPHLRF